MSTAQSGARLEQGEEFLNLDALDQGVQRALGRDTVMGQVLPRSAVQRATWERS